MNKTRADRWLLYAVSSLCLITGASLWETVVFVPVWASGNPTNLSVIRANVGIDSTVLWIVLHSLFEVIYLAALVLNWKLKQRQAALLAIAVMYVGLRLWTVAYFAPTFLTFQKLSSASDIPEALIESTVRWKNLNYIRTSAVVALNIWMLLYVGAAIQPIAAGSEPSRVDRSGA
jgi:hypothetical protein